jgi:hypothetical protein
VRDYEKGAVLLADYNAQSCKAVSKGDEVVMLPEILERNETQASIRNLNVEHRDHESTNPLDQSVLVEVAVEAEADHGDIDHGDMEFEHRTKAGRIKSIPETVGSDKHYDGGHSDFEDEIETAVNEILEESINSYRRNIEETARSIHEWDGSWESSNEILESMPSVETDAQDQRYETEMAEKVLEAEYMRDNYTEELEDLEGSEGGLSGMAERILASETSTVWEDRWGNVMAHDEEDGHVKIADKDSKLAGEYEDIKDRTERLRGTDADESRYEREVREARQSYGSRADFLGAAVQSGLEGNLSEEVEEYLWTEYLPEALGEIDSHDEMEDVGENFYSAIKSKIKRQQTAEMNNLLAEGYGRAGALYSETDFSSSTESVDAGPSPTEESPDGLISRIYGKAREVMTET